MKAQFVISLLIALLIRCAFGEAWLLTLPEAVEQADLIASVRIQLVTPNARADKMPAGAYRSTATAQVVESVKGLKAGESIVIDHDNGYVCPNIILQDHETALVFARKLPNGHYEVMNTYAGHFRVIDGQIEDFYLLGDRTEFAKRATVKAILDELQKRLPKK